MPFCCHSQYTLIVIKWTYAYVHVANGTPENAFMPYVYIAAMVKRRINSRMIFQQSILCQQTPLDLYSYLISLILCLLFIQHNSYNECLNCCDKTYHYHIKRMGVDQTSYPCNTGCKFSLQGFCRILRVSAATCL